MRTFKLCTFTGIVLILCFLLFRSFSKPKQTSDTRYLDFRTAAVILIRREDVGSTTVTLIPKNRNAVKHKRMIVELPSGVREFELDSSGVGIIVTDDPEFFSLTIEGYEQFNLPQSLDEHFAQTYGLACFIIEK